MKALHFVFFAVFVFAAKPAASQCTPIAPLGYPHFYPEADSFPEIEAGENFSGTIHFEGPDSIGSPSGWLYCDSIVINSIQGLPAGISYQTFPATAIPRGQAGCIQLSGTTNDAPGVDTLNIIATLYLNGFGPFEYDISVMNDTAQNLVRYFLRTVDNVSGINDKKTFLLSLFPNPANNHLNITSTLPNHDALNYEIFTLLGKTVVSGNNTADAFSVDVSTLTAGVYFIRLNNGSGNVVKRWVKE